MVIVEEAPGALLDDQAPQRYGGTVGIGDAPD